MFRIIKKDVSKLIYILIGLSIFQQGCDTPFLDKRPIDTITSDNYFTKSTHARDAVSAVYDVLQWEFDYGANGGSAGRPGGASGGWHSHMLYMFGDICSDDAEKGGQNDNDVRVLLELSNFEGNSSAVVLIAPWNISYTGIARASFAINKIQEMSLNEDGFESLKQKYIAEAKFLRALFYFNLVKMYGGVVKVTELLNPSDYNRGRSTEEEIWALIEEDLNAAATVLPTKTDLGESEYGRATRGAAYAFLAKAYVFQGKWQQAKDAAEEVINSNIYSLVDNYEEVFETEGEHGDGSIFEVNFTNTLPGGWPPNASEGTVLHTMFGSREETRYTGWGWHLPTQDLYDEYEQNDYRREATIAKPGDVIYGKALVGSRTYYSRKYIIPDKDIPAGSLGDPQYIGPINLRLMRYADVLLFHAEANARLDSTRPALLSLNKVRARARAFAKLKNPSLASDTTLLLDRESTGDQLIQDIWHERRVELAMEGHRFFDIVRQGRAGEVMRRYGKTKFVDGTHEKFGIPYVVIERTNGGVKQSPDW